MSARVRINYSIEIDKLSQEVDRLLKSAHHCLQSIYDDYELPSDSLSLSTIRAIRQTRARLYDLDHRLSDIDSIVNSYLQYETKQTDQAPEPPLSDSIAKIDTLKDLIGDMRMNSGNADEVSD